MVALGARLKELRERGGLTQEGLAAAASLSRATIAAIEGGRNNVESDTLLSLAKALGVSIDDFYRRRPAGASR